MDAITRTGRSYVAVAVATALASAAWSSPVGEDRAGAERGRIAARGAGAGPAWPGRDQSWPPDPYPRAAAVADARAFAAAAPGAVSFAVMDAAAGVRGLDADSQYSSASASKALLLAAELRRLRSEGEELDEGTRSLLEPMITYSDNDAASAVYARVGDAGIEQVAEAAGMRNLEITPGYWGGAQVTAGDLARFYLGLERNLAGPHRKYGKRLLANVTSSQRWGIPAGAGGAWRVYFKGGWRPAGTTENSGPVTHQAGLLIHRSGRRVAIAILTDQSPGTTSFGTLEGITRRLVARDPHPRAWPYP